MASATALGYLVPLGVGSAAVVGLSSLAHVDMKTVLRNFVTGPGRTSRILLAIFVVTNWKSMPFMWTYRVWSAILRHYLPAFRSTKPLSPDALFQYTISASYTALPETDYNLHKSNSTYFTDLDVARSHCVTHLLQPGLAALAANARTQCVLTPDGQVARGGMGIGLGAVFCSFRREVAPWQPYEMWTRILAWDRKWVYLVTHFVKKGTKAKAREGELGWEKYVIATAVSKYVFKVGRFTVHPSIVIEQSGLLPERPGGWRGGMNEVGQEDEELGDVMDASNNEGDWDWKRVERKRREGMRFAEKFAALDELNGEYNGDEYGVLGKFYPG